MFRYTATSHFTTLWIQGDHSVEARGEFADIGPYKSVLGALRKPT